MEDTALPSGLRKENTRIATPDFLDVRNRWLKDDLLGSLENLSPARHPLSHTGRQGDAVA
jgi:hypothetical protein